jgi:hypothetical protein
MSLLNAQKSKNVVLLALVSVVASVMFSFLGAPLLRAFSVTTKSLVFWATAVFLIAALLVAGNTDFKVSQTAIYVGAIWMTLGSYNELEKRGVSWKWTGLVSVLSGTLFALAGYFFILKNLGSIETVKEMLEPLIAAFAKSAPGAAITSDDLVRLLPGIFMGSLVGALALGLMLESKAAKIFGVKRERVASSLRWLEFRAPDALIWTTLSALLLSVVTQNFWQILSINILFVTLTVFFFQGMAVVEFAMRYYRLGFFTRVITYILIILQLAPILVFVGFADYWADFRRLMRKKSKTTI